MVTPGSSGVCPTCRTPWECYSSGKWIRHPGLPTSAVFVPEVCPDRYHLRLKWARATVGQDSTLSRFTRPSLGEVLTQLAGLRSISGYYM